MCESDHQNSSIDMHQSMASLGAIENTFRRKGNRKRENFNQFIILITCLQRVRTTENNNGLIPKNHKVQIEL